MFFDEIQEIRSWGDDTVFIGHSIAPVFIIKYIIENKIKVSKLIFVSGFNKVFGIDKDYDKVNQSFFCDNVEEIHKYCNDITCIYSDNDPYLSFVDLDDFATKVSDKKEVIADGKHLNWEAGYDKFEEILKYI